MGGLGSGRHRTARSGIPALECLRLDVRQLARGSGALFKGKRVGSTSAVIRGAPVQISLDADENELRLDLNVGGRASRHAIQVERKPAGFGGQRLFWRCPGCGRLRLVMFFARGRAGCRVCLRVVYAVENVDKETRALWAAQKAWLRLGVRNFPPAPAYPAKPPRMHWRTFEGLLAQARALEDRWRKLNWVKLGPEVEAFLASMGKGAGSSRTDALGELSEAAATPVRHR